MNGTKIAILTGNSLQGAPMTVIGNNSANNSNSLATVNLVGSKGSNASAGLSSFLDIISMLSLPDEDLNSLSKAELLTGSFGSEGEPSTIQLLQKFLDKGQVPLLNEVSTKDISEETAKKVDSEIRKIVDKGYERARIVLTEKIDDLHKLAKALLTYETLSGEEIENLVNKNIYPSNKEDLKVEDEDKGSALSSMGLKPKIVH